MGKMKGILIQNEDVRLFKKETETKEYSGKGANNQSFVQTKESPKWDKVQTKNKTQGEIS